MTSNNLFKKYLAQTNQNPLMLEVDFAQGSYIYDKAGKQYLDMIAGVAVNNIGHRHPLVIEAIKNQIDCYLHTMVYGEFIQSIQSKFAKKLTELLPEKLNSVYILNSGTEANEAAIKLIRKYTNRTEIIAFKGSYHGSTNGSLSISYNEKKKSNFRPLLPDIRFIEWNSIQELKYITSRTAGVIIETIQGDAGVRIPNQNFLEALRKKCSDLGCLLVFDEIQCGMGRTGKLFAFEHFGVVPDVLTLGKALGGGMPIGALVADKKVMDCLSHNPELGHITTFGGHPVICASAMACLEVLSTKINWKKVEKIGKKIEEALIFSPGVKKIRRKGMMFAIEMTSKELVNEVVLNCKENGLLAFWFLSHPDCFRLSPPINLSEKEADDAIIILKRSIQECSNNYA